MVVVVVLVVLVTFAIVHITPGSPALNILGQKATPQLIAQFNLRLHLNRPLVDQLWLFVDQVSHGSLGRSLLPGGRDVTALIFPALGVTASLAGLTILFSVLLGVPLGLVAGVRRGVLDVFVRGCLICLLAVPAFFTGFLLLLLALRTGIGPVGGWGTGPLGHLAHLWMPALALSGYLTPIIGRSLRQSVIETSSQDFIEAAIARGLRGRRLVVRHILPNSLLPMITLIGYNAGTLMAGAVVIETIFNLPGLGSQLAFAVANDDYPVVQGVALVAAVVVVIANAAADIAYELTDPRVRG
jgi:peptide/nickel transport system permease protein